ncbi:hypothetical protein LCGC14_0615560 [marine sediment metagenome]|uniref:Lipoprotein n=1 Tax=marine sediment metagenome TaxID=412755 RepID=A0A0F9UEV4_9ZZZZ
MKNVLLCLLVLSAFMCGCGRKSSTSGPPAAVFSWAEIQSAPPTELPGNRHVVSVLHGKKTGEWRRAVQSNVTAETQTWIGEKSILVPETDYGWRYIHYETEDGSVLLHVYLRDIQEIHLPSRAPTTYTRDDVKDDLIAKFRESSEWTILPEQPDAGDGE